MMTRPQAGRVLQERYATGGAANTAAWLRECLGATAKVPARDIRDGNFPGVPEQVVCALNFLRQCTLRVIDESQLESILECFEEFLGKSASLHPDPLGRAVHFVKSYARHPSTPHLAATRGPRLGIAKVVHVLGHARLEQYINGHTHAPLGRRLSPDALRTSYSLRLAIAKKTGGRLWRLRRRTLPSFWFTSEHDVDRIPSAVGPDLPIRVRNWLGLGHYGGTDLYAIHFEPSVIPQIRTPTIFDSGFGVFFCPTRAKDHWGRAVVLPHLRRQGAREAIAAECDWPQVPLTHLGYVSSPTVRPTPIDWTKYIVSLWLDLVRRDKTMKALVSEILS